MRATVRSSSARGSNSGISSPNSPGVPLAVIKIGWHFEKVRRILGDLGLAERSRYIERATMANQKILPLDAVDPGDVPYFSMILVHKRGEAWT